MNASARARPEMIGQLSILSDATRLRLLLLLERHELTVSELCRVVQLPQPSVSRHLRTLTEAGWTESLADGKHRRYRIDLSGVGPSLRPLWLLVRREIQATPHAAQDERRLKGVLAARRNRSRAFFTTEAERWDALRDEMFGPSFHLAALLGLLDDRSRVGDIGCGTGAVSAALAPVVREVVAVDESQAMLAAARRRLRGFANVDLRRGAIESLPIADAELDAATLILVLHHLPDPLSAVREVARTLRSGGRLLLVDMSPHDRQEYRARMGHLWLGFSEERTHALLSEAGLAEIEIRPLQPPAAAKGPALFAARARRQPERHP